MMPNLQCLGTTTVDYNPTTKKVSVFPSAIGESSIAECRASFGVALMRPVLEKLFRSKKLEIDIKVMRKSQESLREYRGVRRVVRSVGSFILDGRDLGKRFAIIREDN